MSGKRHSQAEASTTHASVFAALGDETRLSRLLPARWPSKTSRMTRAKAEHGEGVRKTGNSESETKLRSRLLG